MHPAFATLLRYWLEKRGSAPLPRRRDIDPIELGASLLPDLVLAELGEGEGGARFRLVGTNVVKRIGRDPTGCLLVEALPGGWTSFVASLCRLVHRERAPVAAESEFTWGHGRRLGAHHLLLPLRECGPEPALALGSFLFASEERFPPTLRMLGGAACHVELGRRVLSAAHAGAAELVG